MRCGGTHQAISRPEVLHLYTNQAGILQEVDGNIHIKEEIRNEQPIRSTALTVHGSSEGRCRRESIVQESLLVGGNHSADVVDHAAEVRCTMDLRSTKHAGTTETKSQHKRQV
jgi:hypothetical protein